MSSLNVLVACEESQRVTSAFRSLGHNAFSCDLLPCSGGHPEWHFCFDVKLLFNPFVRSVCLSSGDLISVPKFDLVIAHPPCTFLSAAGNCRLFTRSGIDPGRLASGYLARDFFLYFLDLPVPFIAVENPLPISLFSLPPYSQIIHPYYFGDPFLKRTCLWLKNLPPLVPTSLIHPSFCQSTRSASRFNSGGVDRQRNRSKTFPGVASAMAVQWSKFILRQYSLPY